MEPSAVATAAVPEYASMASAPAGAKCILLTFSGVAVIGVVPLNPEGYAAWAPLPVVPAAIRELMAWRTDLMRGWPEESTL